jgi:hypothetical protein
MHGFRADRPYKIALVPLYLFKDPAMAKEVKLEVKEAGWFENTSADTSRWWEAEKNRWNPSSNFSVSYQLVDCNLSYSEYISIAEKNSEDPFNTFNEIVDYCGIDRNDSDIIAFMRAGGIDAPLPIYGSVCLGRIILAGGLPYPSAPQHADYAMEYEHSLITLVHETIHSFGMPDLYTYPGETYHLSDCYNGPGAYNESLNEKHLCQPEAVMIGLI